MFVGKSIYDFSRLSAVREFDSGHFRRFRLQGIIGPDICSHEKREFVGLLYLEKHIHLLRHIVDRGHEG